MTQSFLIFLRLWALPAHTTVGIACPHLRSVVKFLVFPGDACLLFRSLYQTFYLNSSNCEIDLGELYHDRFTFQLETVHLSALNGIKAKAALHAPSPRLGGVPGAGFSPARPRGRGRGALGSERVTLPPRLKWFTFEL